ncbi:dUTP diphosphatase [Mycoplasmopsis felis]|uniref:dUTP diphosphatase n=1 Tax=Mycoplasmopsis felis TaxID=33923 RepID=UPI002AFDD4D1|nr:dUTP diphosphatase [Mycoplasmopsis felis]WQQ03375.1 dUTP diphosphatase [Mycoplasmopsis felis]WQQ11523.1 dUTP diphosphatase [Mycoplasmopsis felis]
MDLTTLFKLQKKLDKKIDEKRKITQPNLTQQEVLVQRVLALIIEAAEYVNEVQSFKYWKMNKNVDNEKIKEEFADLLHFLINLSYIYDVEPIINPKVISNNINEQFQNLFIEISKLMIFIKENQTSLIKNQIHQIFEIALGSFIELGFTFNDIYVSYFFKNQKNFKRLYTNY